MRELRLGGRDSHAVYSLSLRVAAVHPASGRGIEDQKHGTRRGGGLMCGHCGCGAKTGVTVLNLQNGKKAGISGHSHDDVHDHADVHADDTRHGHDHDHGTAHGYHQHHHDHDHDDHHSHDHV